MTAETRIHPSAVVEDGARLGAGVQVGPFCHVGPHVELGDGVELVGHVSITGRTTLGAGSRVFPHAVLGGPPQNVRHKGAPTTLVIGRDCVIREGATINLGSDNSRGETLVGDRLYMMANAHIAHDCVVGNNVTMANSVALGGHVEIGDFVNIGGFVGIHQFTRIRARLRGFNVIGIKRSGLPRAELAALRAAYRVLFSHEAPLTETAVRAKAEFAQSQAVLDVVDFILSRGKRHFTVPDPDDDGDDQAGDES
jgi:UDP-N-acetylglucosamine acyltransferase